MATVKNDKKLAIKVRKYPCLYDKSCLPIRKINPKKMLGKKLIMHWGNQKATPKRNGSF